MSIINFFGAQAIVSLSLLVVALHYTPEHALFSSASTPAPLSQTSSPAELFTPSNEALEFPGCSGKSGFDFIQCINDAIATFNEYYVTDAEQCFKSEVGVRVPTKVYVSNCPDCPPHRLCTSIGGLCASPGDGPTLPSFFNDCKPGDVCVKEPGFEPCISNLFGRPPYDVSTCTCSQNKGVFMSSDECSEQCGANGFAADQPPSGPFTPLICCLNVHQCPDWHKYTCVEGSATLSPICSGNGEVSCTEGDLQLIVEPVPRPPLLGGTFEGPSGEGPDDDMD